MIIAYQVLMFLIILLMTIFVLGEPEKESKMSYAAVLIAAIGTTLVSFVI